MPLKKEVIKKKYQEIAILGGSCCSGDGCCRGLGAADLSKSIGYSEDDVQAVPDANMGLGCGNPTALTELKPGDIVLDLGSGARFDCFLAAQRVGSSGKVIGVEMTPKWLKKRRLTLENTAV